MGIFEVDTRSDSHPNTLFIQPIFVFVWINVYLLEVPLTLSRKYIVLILGKSADFLQIFARI